MARRTGINTFEVIVVIVIIGVLAALLLPTIQSAREEGREIRNAVATTSTDTPARLGTLAVTIPTEPFFQDANENAGQDTTVRFGQPTEQVPADAARKIIYESQLNLVVEDIAAAETEIAKLTKTLDGYVAEASVDRTAGERVTARWRLRVPVAKFDDLLAAVAKLGVVENRQQTTQDVTEQFVDLEAQIANKKKLEERIVKLLEDTTGQLKDVIEVERELARVRGEIERMEGRLRYLSNRTDLSSVTIFARVEKNYIPPTAPDLEKRVETAWESSLEKLQLFGERALVAAVYAGPWIGVAIVLLVPAFWYISRRRRTAKLAVTK